ncbi:hypothetical protein [Ruminococcus flavefaciens]|uniref:hypothetical protein n=1 Tax=Ruminococcus flavefaciens TaxID=1265 RepID=UPI0026EE4AA3|nr:hypothetical protein [Ruminococcus flavefaciens]
MKAKKMILRTASLIAAAALSAVIPLFVPQGVFTSASLTAYADESSGDLITSQRMTTLSSQAVKWRLHPWRYLHLSAVCL